MKSDISKWKNDKQNDNGTFSRQNGGAYRVFQKDFQKTGKGFFTSQNADVHRGDKKDDKIFIKGIYEIYFVIKSLKTVGFSRKNSDV